MSTSNYIVYYDSEAVKTLKELQDIKIEKKSLQPFKENT